MAFWYPLFYHIGDWETRDTCKRCLVVIGPLTALLKSHQQTPEKVGLPAIWLNSEDGDTDAQMVVSTKALLISDT
jgi:hypothetical protein